MVHDKHEKNSSHIVQMEEVQNNDTRKGRNLQYLKQDKQEASFYNSVNGDMIVV